MKYFIDTHDKAKGSFPSGELSEEEFFAQFDAIEAAAPEFGASACAAHVNLTEGKAFCFMCGPDEGSIRKAHEAVHLPYDSITEVKRVTGAEHAHQDSAARQAAEMRTVPRAWYGSKSRRTTLPERGRLTVY